MKIIKDLKTLNVRFSKKFSHKENFKQCGFVCEFCEDYCCLLKNHEQSCCCEKHKKNQMVDIMMKGFVIK